MTESFFKDGAPIPTPMFMVSRNKALQDLLAKYPDDAEVYIDVYEKLCILVNDVEVARIWCECDDTETDRRLGL